MTTTRTTGAGPRVLLMGGSTAFGLGVRGRSFGVLAAEQLDAAAVLDLTASGPLLDESLGRWGEVEAFAPQVAVLCVGHAEQVVHPALRVQRTIERFAPPTWHGVAGLQPRPYFSTSRATRVRQHVTSRAKTVVKTAAIRAGGGHQRMPLETFRGHLADLLARLDALGVTTVVLGSWPVDAALFPGTGAAFARLEEAIATEADRVGSAHFLAPTPRLQVWQDYLADHMHWDHEGHARIAAAVVELVDAAEVR